MALAEINLRQIAVQILLRAMAGPARAPGIRIRPKHHRHWLRVKVETFAELATRPNPGHGQR